MGVISKELREKASLKRVQQIKDKSRKRKAQLSGAKTLFDLVSDRNPPGMSPAPCKSKVTMLRLIEERLRSDWYTIPQLKELVGSASVKSTAILVSKVRQAGLTISRRKLNGEYEYHAKADGNPKHMVTMG